VDSNNEKIKTGDTDQTPSEIFYTQFTENLQEFLEASPNSLILIVPSVRDVISGHCVYPQSPLDVSRLSFDPVSRPDKYVHFSSYIFILAN
jgi:DNA polymerase alpha subunit B